MKSTNRRMFIERTMLTGAGIGLSGGVMKAFANSGTNVGRKIGMIGLDTSHCIAFTKL